MTINLLLCVLRLLGPSSGIAAEPELPFVDSRAFNQRIGDQNRQQLREGKFDALESTANSYRHSKVETEDGYRKLWAFYDAFFPRIYESEPSESEWKDRLNSLNAWMEQRPTSETARIAAAAAWVGYAWHARTHGPGSRVSKEQAALFKERLKQAERLLDESMKGTDDPYRYILRIGIGLGLRADRTAMLDVVDKALAEDSGNYAVLDAMGVYLMPRWYGKKGEWVEFAARMAQKYQRPDFYTRIVVYVLRQEGTMSWKAAGVSWPALGQGFNVLLADHPDSLPILSQFAYYAALVGDHHAACELAPKLGGVCELWAWDERVIPVKGRAITMYRTFQKWLGDCPAPAAGPAGTGGAQPETAAQARTAASSPAAAESAAAAKPSTRSAVPTAIPDESTSSLREVNVAVANLKPEGVSASDAAVIADLLRGELVSAGLQVVEKSNMDKVLVEQAFQQTGCTSAECAVKLGKLLNVQQMVVGSFGKLMEKYFVSLRLVNVETGAVVYADNANGRKVEDIQAGVKTLALKIAQQVK